MITTPVDSEFRDGDSVVLAHGTYQGTPGVFLRLKDDPNWADITERNGRIRSHPVAWLAHTMVDPQMNACVATDIGAWEDEGGAAPALADVPAVSGGSGNPFRETSEDLRRSNEGLT